MRPGFRLAHVLASFGITVPTRAAVMVNAAGCVDPNLAALGRLSNERSC